MGELGVGGVGTRQLHAGQVNDALGDLAIEGVEGVAVEASNCSSKICTSRSKLAACIEDRSRSAIADVIPAIAGIRGSPWTRTASGQPAPRRIPSGRLLVCRACRRSSIGRRGSI